MSGSIPRGAQPIVESLRRGEAWQGDVVVSFTGQRTPFDALHVFPARGAAHDWRWINGLHVWVIAAAGAGDDEAMSEIAWRCRPFAGLVDTGLKAVAHLVSCGHGDAPKVWQAQQDSPDWQAWFGEGMA